LTKLLNSARPVASVSPRVIAIIAGHHHAPTDTHHSHPRNSGTPLDLAWFDKIAVNTPAATARAATLATRRSVKKEWQVQMKEELGRDWLRPDLFRIGASSLLGDIGRQLEHHVTGRYALA